MAARTGVTPGQFANCSSTLTDLKDVPPPTEEMLFRRSPMCYRGAVVMLQAFRVQLDWDELVSFARWLDLSSTVSEWCDSLVLL
jgi:hypothetical protein